MKTKSISSLSPLVPKHRGYYGISQAINPLAFIILLTCLGFMAFSLNGKTTKMRNLRGKILDSISQHPVKGVEIRYLDSSHIMQKVYSDSNGLFSIKQSGSEKFMVELSHLGYSNQKTAWGNSDYQTFFLIPLTQNSTDSDSSNRLKSQVVGVPVPKDSELNEVAVMGYGAKRKEDLNGSVSSINNKYLNDEAVSKVPSPISKTMARIDKTIRKNNYFPRAINPGIQTSQEDESYQEIKENGFQDPAETPLSTFSVNVNTSSYGNIRRYINQGQFPPKDAVRIEEMINYFHYDIDGPKNNDPVAIHTEVSQAPWNRNHPLVRIGLKTKNIPTQNLPPAHLVFLLDVSGSMEVANKLPLVKNSMELLVDQLRSQDKVAIVVYAGEAGLRLPMTPGDQKTKIKDVIESLQAGGSTAGGAGLRLAYKIAQREFVQEGNNRIILATDGDFNVGPASDKDMEQLIEEEDKSGVKISILGFGMGNLKDSKMERMAYKGHGNYAYIDNILEASKAMVNEFGGSLFTQAKDVKLQVEFNPAKVEAYRLLGYENRTLNKEDFNNDQKNGGDMGPGQEVIALYEIIPTGQENPFHNVDSLKYQRNTPRGGNNFSSELMTVKFRYKYPHSESSKMVKAVVPEGVLPFEKSSEDFRFSACVAEWALLLRKSEFKQQANFNELIRFAKLAKGRDEEGYRAEFIRLVELSRLMKEPEQANK